MKFRALTANDIEVRVQSAKASGVCLLLYKNARVDMNILDETVEPENWQREHYECKGNLFCRVGIKTTDGWVYKSDCGVESTAEAKKGEASDSFKRACFNWGIGRELYTSPFIFIKSSDCKIHTSTKGNKEVYACYDDFVVEKIKIEKGVITGLAIKNATNNKRVFVWQAESRG